MRVPTDFSIVGYDDFHPEMLTGPFLTTIRQNLEEIGETAAKNLLESIRHPEYDANHAFEPQLIVRASTAPAPK